MCSMFLCVLKKCYAFFCGFAAISPMCFHKVTPSEQKIYLLVHF